MLPVLIAIRLLHSLQDAVMRFSSVMQLNWATPTHSCYCTVSAMHALLHALSFLAATCDTQTHTTQQKPHMLLQSCVAHARITADNLEPTCVPHPNILTTFVTFAAAYMACSVGLLQLTTCNLIFNTRAEAQPIYTILHTCLSSMLRGSCLWSFAACLQRHAVPPAAVWQLQQ